MFSVLELLLPLEQSLYTRLLRTAWCDGACSAQSAQLLKLASSEALLGITFEVPRDALHEKRARKTRNKASESEHELTQDESPGLSVGDGFTAMV
jgi:hypothetical protein